MFDVFWFRFPLLRPLFALILGIVIQANWGLNWHYLLFWVFLNTGLFLFFKFLKSSFYSPIIESLFLQLNVFFVGVCLVSIQQNQHVNFIKDKNNSSDAYIQIEKSLASSPQTENYLVALYTKAAETSQYHYSGKLLLKRNQRQRIEIGKCFQIQVSDIEPFAEARNEYDFDFANYYLRKGIDAQLNQQAIVMELKQTETKTIQFWINAFQRYLKELILKKIANEDCSSVLLALIDGEDDYISKDLIKAYAALGTLHVLAVSGMHVNLLFGIIEIIFLAFKRPRFKYPILIVQLSIIWFYALVCGFSPSIIRASLMITLYTFSKAMNRPQSQLNLLFNAAFLMLLFQPYLLFDTGFQLSFMAVLGLLVFNSSISQVFEFKNKLSKAIWSLCAASISAQIACLPLSIYYFHQLPLLFLPANLIAIPICTLAIYWGLVLVCIPILPSFLWTGLTALLDFNNQITVYLSNLKFAKIDQLYLSLNACILLALVIAGFYVYFKFKLQKAFQLALIFLIFIQIEIVKRNWDLCSQRKVQLYAYGNHPGISIIAGQAALAIADSTILKKNIISNALKLNQNKLLAEFTIHPNFHGLLVENFYLQYHHALKHWSIESKLNFKNKHGKQGNQSIVYMNPKNTAFSLLLY